MWAFVALFGLALIGCHMGQQARADAPEANLNEAFMLGGRQEAVIAGENLRLRFDQVLEDSRCPVRVECVWTGQARIAIVVQPDGGEPSTVTFNTNPAPGQTINVVAVGDHTVELQSLDPYPQSPEEPIPVEDYRATLLVRRA
jgi:hypothetical protein